MKKIFTLSLGTLFFSVIAFAQSSSIYGTCGWGGSMNWGTIVKGNGDGSGFQPVYNFDNTNGAEPVGGLCLADNGKLYGVTYLGGYGDSCVCFEYDTSTGTYTKFYDLFQDISQGWDAWSAMMKADDGNLYGLCAAGGLNSAGVIYRIDPNTDTYTAIYHMNSAQGGSPFGGLIQLSDGKLYGMTSYGGAHNAGAIFSYDPLTGTYIDLYDLKMQTGGMPMYGSLLKATDGKLYGMTQSGGANYDSLSFNYNSGVIFSYDLVSGVYTDLYDFDSTHGSSPYGGLMQASNGLLYGMTYSGGANNMGVVFSFDITNNSFQLLHSFEGTDGAYPRRNLTETSNGKLYGCTSNGGANGSGTFFSFDISSNQLTTLVSCDATFGTSPDCDIIETGVVAHGDHTTSLGNTNSDLSVYPSPAIKEISLFANAISEKDLISVTDVTGKVILQKQATTNHMANLNVSSLASGIYFVEVKTSSGTLSKKFVKL